MTSSKGFEATAPFPRIFMHRNSKLKNFSLPPGWIGFTLIELLTVVAVIGILAGILLGSLARAKASARSVICLNQMRQVGLAVSTYMSGSRYYPSYRVSEKGPQFGMYEDWQFILAPYLGGEDAMYKFSNCPLRWAPAYNSTKVFYLWNELGAHTDASLNLGLGTIDWKNLNSPDLFVVSETMVKNPSDMVMIAECESPYQWSGTIEHAVPVRPIGIHNGRGNFLFTDGHVGRLSPLQVTNPIPDVTRRWNNDHEIHPGKFEIY